MLSVSVKFAGVAFLAVVGLAPALLTHSDMTAAASNIPECGSSQVFVAATGSGGAAGGNEADIFLIVNKSRSTCAVKGFPVLRFTTETSPFVKVKVLHEASMIFTEPPAKSVVLLPGRVASFGVGFGTAANQQKINDSSCLSNSLFVTMPRSNSGNFRFYVANTLNVCGTGYTVDITPFEAGPVPEKQ
jgi:hypothetical protein